MTDKEEIKFAIRYLKKGLKSERTPPLYEVLMNELGFVKKDKVNNLVSVAEVRLANWQKYSKELKEAKEIIKDFLSLGIFGIFKRTTAEEIICRAEQFLKE